MIGQYPPVYERREYGSITDLAVTAEFRRRGVGRRLFEAARDWFASGGLDRLEVRVATTNELSTAFWRGLGFEPYMESLRRPL